jgi:hypothetical protein
MVATAIGIVPASNHAEDTTYPRTTTMTTISTTTHATAATDEMATAARLLIHEFMILMMITK